MAMATGWFGLTWEGAIENTKAVDIDGDVLKGQLHIDTFTPNFETHDFHNDLANEVSGTGYTAGGVTLASVTSAIAAGVYTFDAADFSWTTSTFTARGDIIVDTTPGTSATNWLILARTYGADFTVTAGTFTTQHHASGIWTAAYR